MTCRRSPPIPADFLRALFVVTGLLTWVVLTISTMLPTLVR